MLSSHGAVELEMPSTAAGVSIQNNALDLLAMNCTKDGPTLVTLEFTASMKLRCRMERGRMLRLAQILAYEIHGLFGDPPPIPGEDNPSKARHTTYIDGTFTTTSINEPWDRDGLMPYSKRMMSQLTR